MPSEQYQRTNVIYIANIHYPHGLACTKMIQNTIDHFAKDPHISQKVLILRQGRVKLIDSALSGQHKGTEYTIIGSDIKAGLSALWTVPRFYLQGMAYIKRHRRKGMNNILYVYGYPNTDNLAIVLRARLLKYKVVFQIVEDADVQGHAPDILARIKRYSERFLARGIHRLADLILPVSQRLYRKLDTLTKGQCPLLMHPVTMKMNDYPETPTPLGNPMQVLYGGTYGEKDGVDLLIRAFDDVCHRHDNLQLILTGKGDVQRMAYIQDVIDKTTHNDRIIYKGYIETDHYYDFISRCDIPCMIRTGSDFAHAGFPFKFAEYLATGKPVIASKVSDVSHYATDKHDTMLVEPDNLQSLIDALDYLVAHPEKARQIGLNGRRLAQERLNSAVIDEAVKQTMLKL